LAGIALFNLARSTLAVAVASGDATIQVVSGGPWSGATGPFTVMIESEAIRCSGINGNTLQVAANGRGFDGTSPQAHPLTDSLGNATAVVGALVRRDLQDGFVRLDTAAPQTLTGPLTIPPAIGSTAPATSYGTLMNKIDEQVVVNVASITVPATGVLPTGYRNLRLRIKLRGLTSAANVGLWLRSNADAGANHSYQQISGNNVTAAAAGADAANQIVFGNIPANTAPANSFCGIDLCIYDYNSATDHKSMTWTAFQRSAASASGLVTYAGGGIWLSAAVLTTLQILAAAGNVSGLVETFGEP
jgi:hypothetical protein